MKQHTEGPWIYRPETRAIITEPNRVGQFVTVAHISESAFISEPEHEANAMLVTTAPDLLEALTSLLETYENAGGKFTLHERMDSVRNARAAIAKATV